MTTSLHQNSPMVLGLLFPVLISAGVGAYFAFEGGLFFGLLMVSVLALVVVGMLAFARVTITVDGTKVAARSALFGFPLLTVPLNQMVRVSLDRSTVGNFGGWGYRKSGRDTALILHGSQAAVIERIDGRKALFVIDEAEKLVDVLQQGHSQ